MDSSNYLPSQFFSACPARAHDGKEYTDKSDLLARFTIELLRTIGESCCDAVHVPNYGLWDTLPLYHKPRLHLLQLLIVRGYHKELAVTKRSRASPSTNSRAIKLR